MSLKNTGPLPISHKSGRGFQREERSAMNFKALFSTPKKAAAIVACLLAVMAAVGIGIGYVMRGNTGFLDETGAIGGENAKNFAFADAGVDPVSAQAVRVTYERFEREFVYSVEFSAGGTEYTYKISAGDGSVVRKESRTVYPDSTVPLSAAITLEQAQEIALADAGVIRGEAIFARAEAGTGAAGQPVYIFRFYAANVEYEYEINAATGAVYSKKTGIYKDPEAAATAPVQTAAPTARPTDRPDPTAGPTQSAAPTPSPAASDPQPTDRTGGLYIGRDAAKSAALAHAKVSAGEARFTQVRIDYEDGEAVYVLNFYTSAREYQYKIDAKTGAVLSRETKERSN